MELGSKKAAIRLACLGALLLGGAFGQELRFDVRHERALGDHRGVLSVDDEGISFEQTPTPKQTEKAAKGGKRPGVRKERFPYPDIQQLWVAPDKLVLVTYKDRKWFLGIDKEFVFWPESLGEAFTPVYEKLRTKLDQRLTAAIADSPARVEWELPVKLLGTLQGSEGVLQIGEDRIVYSTPSARTSRTWRLEDIENISTSGPFQLSITSFERAKAQYGNRRGFQFQLKHKLDEKQYNALWRRLQRDKGLDYLKTLEAQTK
jgi:hypothetical protein